MNSDCTYGRVFREKDTARDLSRVTTSNQQSDASKFFIYREEWGNTKGVTEASDNGSDIHGVLIMQRNPSQSDTCSVRWRVVVEVGVIMSCFNINFYSIFKEEWTGGTYNIM
jgi:hypothetical protein